MIEFLTEREKATLSGKWAQFKDFTSGSKGEVKKRIQKKGGWWSVFSGLIASATASGELGKHNSTLQRQQQAMEKAGIDTLHSMNILMDAIQHDRPQYEVAKAAKRLKMDNMMMKKQASEMIRVIDEYKRVHDDDKKAGALRWSDKEYDRHDFREIYKHLNMIEDSTFYVDKAASAAMTGQTDYAVNLMRHIINDQSRR
ncbi:hypothetical protein MYOV011v1_p0184 [Vibrio phage 6E35.1a]|nr:hypothetical protein MYOV011v1_p0184 [Vibrio phage 6E35.1a]